VEDLCVCVPHNLSLLGNRPTGGDQSRYMAILYQLHNGNYMAYKIERAVFYSCQIDIYVNVHVCVCVCVCVCVI